MLHPYLRQALMRYCNEYFAMSEDEQSVFKLQEHDKLDKKIRKFIKKKINSKVKKLEGADQLEFNTIILPWQGIGKNYFMLNESDWNEKILKFNNLYEYNEDYHNFQEGACVEDFTNYEAKPLFNRLSCWARAFIDDKFFYISPTSYQWWLYYALDEASFDWFEQNIKHEYVSGPDDGKVVDGGTLWDMELDANGLEGYYHHMSDFSRKWIMAFYDALDNDAWDEVYVIYHENTYDPFDPAVDYVFGSMNVLKEITFANFIDDCENVRGDEQELIKVRDDAISKLMKALDDEFVEIQKRPAAEFEKEYEEKRKKGMNVVIAPGAFDGLEDE